MHTAIHRLASRLHSRSEDVSQSAHISIIIGEWSNSVQCEFQYHVHLAKRLQWQCSRVVLVVAARHTCGEMRLLW